MLVPLEEVRPERRGQSQTPIEYLSHLASRQLHQRPFLIALSTLVKGAFTKILPVPEDTFAQTMKQYR